MKTKEELLSKCRFYQGEAECPPGAYPFWECERVAVEALLSRPLPVAFTSHLETLMDLHLQVGLDDFFDMVVKAELLSWFCYQSDLSPAENAEHFKRFYRLNYLGQSPQK